VETQWLPRVFHLIEIFGRSCVPPSVRELLNRIESQLGRRITGFNDDIQSLADSDSDVSSTMIFCLSECGTLFTEQQGCYVEILH
jgi:hypothetical protein